MTRRALGIAAGLAAISCGSLPPRPWPPPTAAEWKNVRGQLDALRARIEAAPSAARVRLLLRDGRSGQVIEGRGAVAFAPGRAVRMILLGAGGVTLVDAWVTADEYRVAIPPMNVVARGGPEEPSELPVGFLRWWFLRPLSGSLFAGSVTAAASTWLLRDRDAVVTLRLRPCRAAVCLGAARRSKARSERLEEWRHGPVRGRGDRVDYRDDVTGLALTLVVEDRSTAAPPEAAFEDPDAEEAQ